MQNLHDHGILVDLAPAGESSDKDQTTHTNTHDPQYADTYTHIVSNGNKNGLNIHGGERTISTPPAKRVRDGPST